jgi:hypothetical protein
VSGTQDQRHPYLCLPMVVQRAGFSLRTLNSTAKRGKLENKVKQLESQ